MKVKLNLQRAASNGWITGFLNVFVFCDFFLPKGLNGVARRSPSSPLKPFSFSFFGESFDGAWLGLGRAAILDLHLRSCHS